MKVKIMRGFVNDSKNVDTKELSKLLPLDDDISSEDGFDSAINIPIAQIIIPLIIRSKFSFAVKKLDIKVRPKLIIAAYNASHVAAPSPEKKP
jgi:hypothetical protein